jgi:hypothetical protein
MKIIILSYSHALFGVSSCCTTSCVISNRRWSFSNRNMWWNLRHREISLCDCVLWWFIRPIREKTCFHHSPFSVHPAIFNMFVRNSLAWSTSLFLGMKMFYQYNVPNQLQSQSLQISEAAFVKCFWNSCDVTAYTRRTQIAIYFNKSQKCILSS